MIARLIYTHGNQFVFFMIIQERCHIERALLAAKTSKRRFPKKNIDP